MQKVLIKDYEPDFGEIVDRVGEYLEELDGTPKQQKRLRSEFSDLHLICLKDVFNKAKSDLTFEAMEAEIQELETAEDLRNSRRGGLVRFG